MNGRSQSSRVQSRNGLAGSSNPRLTKTLVAIIDTQCWGSGARDHDQYIIFTVINGFGHENDQADKEADMV